MTFAKSFAAAFMIAGLLPFAAASEPANAKVFDWSLTGPSPALGGVPVPGSGTITASPTGSPGVWAIDTITGMVNGSEITGTSTFDGADNKLFTNGFAFVSTTGISFETAAGQSVNIFSFFGQGTPPTGNAYGELSSNPSGFGVGTFALTAVPEASTWAMMVIGFAGVGVAGYRATRKRVTDGVSFVPLADPGVATSCVASPCGKTPIAAKLGRDAARLPEASAPGSRVGGTRLREPRPVVSAGEVHVSQVFQNVGVSTAVVGP